MSTRTLAAVRACLSPGSVKLLDQCAEALESEGLLEVLLEQTEALAETFVEVGVDDDRDVALYALGPMAELLLREYLGIVLSEDLKTVAEKRSAMQNVARMAGFVA